MYRRRRFATRRPLRRRRPTRRGPPSFKRALVPRYRAFRPFPDKQIATLKYVDFVQVDPSATANTNYVYSANNIYDPNVTGTGHQPSGHDLYEQIYNHYRVLRSTIRIRVIPNENSIAGAAFVGICTNDDGTAPTSPATMMEQPGAKTRAVTYNQICTMSHSFNVHKKFPYNFQATTASFGASPSEQHYYVIYVGPINTAALNPGNFSIAVQISYTVLMWERKDYGES